MDILHMSKNTSKVKWLKYELQKKQNNYISSEEEKGIKA